MKALGIILILSAGIILAFKMYNTSLLRIKILRRLISDFHIIKNEIVYKHTPLYDAIKCVTGKGVLTDFYHFLLSGLENSLPVKEVFEKGIEKLCGLKDKDREAIHGLASVLGATDVKGQAEAFDIFTALVSKNLTEAEKFIKENTKPKCVTVLFIFVVAGLIMI